MFKKWGLSFLLLALSTIALGGNAHAAGEAGEAEAKKMEAFTQSLKPQSGAVTLPNQVATLNLPDTFNYLVPADAKRVLSEAWGNPPDDSVLGLIVPTNFDPFDNNAWAVVITYNEDGHVNDSDAKDIDYNDLLKDMQEGIKDANAERAKQGYPTMELIGWAESPRYDATSHKLYWAKEISVNSATTHTLNYNIRILGRKGVLVLNAIAGMPQLGQVKTEMQKVIAFTDFSKGNTYTDFDKSSDKTAEYGIAALVAGGVAAKLGFFGKLFAIILAAKKFIILAVVGIWLAIKKFLGIGDKSKSIE